MPFTLRSPFRTAPKTASGALSPHPPSVGVVALYMYVSTDLLLTSFLMRAPSARASSTSSVRVLIMIESVSP